MINEKFAFPHILLLSLLLAGLVYAGTVKFDFGPMGDTDHDGDVIAPEPGYIGVDPTMMYGDQNYMGHDYGITLYDGASTATGHEKSSWHTRSSRTSLAIDYIYFNNKRSAFEIALPNGDYLVTVAGGNAAWDENEIRLRMEGNLYGSTNPGSINDNVYILDVCPVNRGDDGYLTWTLEDKEQHDDMSGYGIETWGGNNSHGPGEDSFMHMEIGYLRKQPVTVTDGRLSISGWEYGGTKICFVEITGDPPLTIDYDCATLKADGRNFSGDITGDCRVNFKDFAVLAGDWMQCNDPNDDSCMENW